MNFKYLFQGGYPVPGLPALGRARQYHIHTDWRAKQNNATGVYRNFKRSFATTPSGMHPLGTSWAASAQTHSPASPERQRLARVPVDS